MRRAYWLLGVLLGMVCMSAQAMDGMRFERMRAAADRGDVGAMIVVGRAYRDGDGTARNPHRAFQYFSRASDRGSAEGMYWVGMCYLYGTGVGQSTRSARHWFERADRHGFGPARQMLATMPPDGSSWGAPPPPPPPGPIVYGGGNPTVVNVYGDPNSYYGFTDGSRDFRHLTRDAQRGDPQAGYQLAMAYLQGTNGAPIQPRSAFDWMNRTAKNGYGPAMRQLASMYRQGLGTKASHSEYRYWDQMARRMGY